MQANKTEHELQLCSDVYVLLASGNIATVQDIPF